MELDIRGNGDVLITIYPAVGRLGYLPGVSNTLGMMEWGFPKRPVAYKCRFCSYRIPDLPEIPQNVLIACCAERHWFVEVQGWRLGRDR